MNPDEDEYIPSWNGTRGTPQDKLAIGCMWLIGAIPVVAVLVGLAQWAEHWWKGTP